MKKLNRRRSGEHGQTMTEFALALPVLLLVLVGTVVFGIAFNNYETLTFATNIGAQQLSISRGPTGDPCATTASGVKNAAPFLNTTHTLYTIVLNGVTATTASANPSCSSYQSDVGEGDTATVTVTYPCSLQILLFNPAPSCLLTAQTSVIIQ
jgi:Flp pilus assembly protein TadG